MSLKEERRKNNGPEARASCPVESCEKTEEAADKAVKKVFAIFGVDVDVPKEVEEFRVGLRFGNDMQKYAKRGMMALVVVFASALVLATFAGIGYKISCMIAPPGQGG